MKRLLFRIGALGTVVVLGVIAIAQAQRGAETPPAVESPAANKTPSAGDIARPLSAASDPAANPLRSSVRQVAATEEIASDLVQTGGRPGSVKPPVQLMPKPGADPFGLPTAAKVATPAPALSSDDQPSAAPERYPDIPDASALPRRMAQEASRGVEINDAAEPPSGSAAIQAPARNDSGMNDSAGLPDRYTRPSRPSDRYAAAPPAGSDADEPAPLKADPFATPTAPLRQGAAAAGNAFPQARATAAADHDSIPDASALEAGSAAEGTGKPGGKQLEGPQNPQLTIQKSAPEEIQVGKAATFRVVVRNTGTIAASAVEVRDQIPKGTRLIGTQPQASRGARGELVWSLGTIKPGEEAAVEMQLMPVSEGEIGSVATVVFGADASAHSVSTRPQLVLETSAPERALVGSEILLTITVSNPGSGVATGVVLEEHIPAGLQHTAGSSLEYEVGELRPGASRKLELTLVADRPGPVTNILVARGDGNLQAENRRNLEITSPQLDIVLEGPKKRYLEREATYQLSISNPGTAPAEQVDLVAYLPSGLKFVSANNGGNYDEAKRAVHWRLEELPVNEVGTVELVTLPVEAGQQALKLQGTAQKGVKVEREQPVLIEGIAAILFQAVDTIDPVEVGGETTYEIRVVNQGSKAATNVRVAVLLPAEMKAVAAEGPTRNVVEGSRVLFDGLARLAPKADTTYRVRAQGLRPGDLRTRIQLMTDEMQTPVTKEESTRVYADE